MRCFPCKRKNSRHASLAAIMALLLILMLALAGCGAPTSTPASNTANGTTNGTANSTTNGTTTGTTNDTTNGTTNSMASDTAANPSAEADSGELPVFNKDTLSEYNGQNGARAYVAVNGVVYDVTDVPNWSGGMHQGNTAGMDQTSAMGHSPHGERVLKNLPVVGTYE